jgi:hypothetical protein
MLWLLTVFGPLLAGGGMYVMSNHCKGKNAKSFFRYGAWGFWLLYLNVIPGPFMFPLSVLNLIVKLAPAVICFFLAVNSIIKEMRAQSQGQYTDAA